jgi:hypothetical protein
MILVIAGEVNSIATVPIKMVTTAWPRESTG